MMKEKKEEEKKKEDMPREKSNNPKLRLGNKHVLFLQVFLIKKPGEYLPASLFLIGFSLFSLVVLCFSLHF